GTAVHIRTHVRRDRGSAAVRRRGRFVSRAPRPFGFHGMNRPRCRQLQRVHTCAMWTLKPVLREPINGGSRWGSGGASWDHGEPEERMKKVVLGLVVAVGGVSTADAQLPGTGRINGTGLEGGGGPVGGEM